MNKKLSIFKQGEGRPVILLHGFISTHRYWNDVVNCLSKEKVQVVVPDLLGFGSSPKPKTSTYSLEEHVTWLENSLEAILEQKPVLVGHSMGACIALQWLLDKPELFSGAVLTGLPYVEPHTLRSQVLGLADSDKVKNNPQLEKVADYLLRGVSYAPKKLMPYVMKNIPKHVAEDTPKHKAHTRKKIVDQLFLSVGVLEKIEKLSLSTTMILAHDDSMILDYSRLKKKAQNNPSINFVEVGGGHQIPLEHPSLVAEKIMGIIETP